MPKPRVLVFIDWYLPGYRAGGPVRSMANLVDHLRDRVSFHIVARNTDYTTSDPYPGTVPDSWTPMPGGERVWYASKKGTTWKAWKRILKEEQWDVVYTNGLYSWWYNILPLWLARGLKARRVVAVRGMLASGAMRHGIVRKLLFLSLARMMDLYKGVCFQATNEEEAKDIRMHVQKFADVRVVPNLPKVAGGERLPVHKEPGSAKLVSVARIAVEKNTLLAINSLRGVAGQVQYSLYGPVYDGAYWAQCLAAISALPPNVRVEHRGAVPPEEVAAVLAAHHALFMPSAGENFGHTMLEALSVGRPLLISDRTPWRMLERDQAGWDLPLDIADGFTRAVQQICEMDQVEYDRWSDGAFARGTRYLADQAPVEASLKLFLP
ncbi:MAG: glycosyltransferase family 4 protein [Flavobacteriales bacterium]|nr:glycosyltransferase family 4 protein [Flavobacteriales bacterium]